MKIDQSVFKASKAGNIPFGVPVAARVNGKDELLISTKAGLLNIENGDIVDVNDVASYGEVDATLTVVGNVKEVKFEAARNDSIGTRWIIVDEKTGKGFLRIANPYWNRSMGKSDIKWTSLDRATMYKVLETAESRLDDVFQYFKESVIKEVSFYIAE